MNWEVSHALLVEVEDCQFHALRVAEAQLTAIDAVIQGLKEIGLQLQVRVEFETPTLKGAIAKDEFQSIVFRCEKTIVRDCLFRVADTNSFGSVSREAFIQVIPLLRQLMASNVYRRDSIHILTELLAQFKNDVFADTDTRKSLRELLALVAGC